VAQYVTVSIGIARTVPDEEMSFNELYEEADQALYQAKKHGRNCIVFEGNLYGRIKNGIAQAISM
jgi:diguanylate cyclase (GGDEF)-like protein